VFCKATRAFGVVLISLLSVTACSGGGGSPPAALGSGRATPTASPLPQVSASLPPATPLPQITADPPAAEGGAYGFAGIRAWFEHSLICDNGILIANYAQQYGITTIFVPVTGDDILGLLANNPTTVKNLNAMTAVASVYFVSGDPTWLASPSIVPSDATSLAKIAALFPQVAGILYAVDPEQSPSWNTSQRQALISSYSTLVQTLLGQAGASAFKQTFFLAHSDWSTLHVGTAGGPTLLTSLENVNGIHGLDLIASGNSASAQLSGISSSLAQLSKPFWIEASTSPYVPQSYNGVGVSASTLQSNLSQLQQSVEAQNGNLLGIEVNGWTDLYNSLQSVLPQPPVFNGVLASGPLVPPAGTAYLGAAANPDNNASGTTPALTAAFESQIGRKLAYNLHFYGFTKPFPGANEADDVANGRIPVLAWNCGDSDANVAAGKDDATLITTAQAIKAFGKPILLRWFWEMNLDDTNNGRQQCYDPATDLPDGYFSPTHFIAAWQHIHNVFAAQGATNAIWLWCTAYAHGGPSQYYPGDNYVDWIGMDDYDANNVSMASTFFGQAEELSQFQEKPLMIVETGALAAKQAAFLDGGASVLQSQFPQVRAIGYLDAEGSSQDWVLSPAGLAAFTTFANSPYLSAMPSTP
jgi:hypothetical protein